MNRAGKSDRPPACRPPCGVPGKPANKDGSRRRRRGYGEPYTGTQAEMPDTAKGAPTVTPAGSNRAAERVEGRGLAKGNPHQQNTPRTPRRQYGVHSALERIRQAARRDRTLRFTALMHHVDNPAILREAYFSRGREAAPGVDRVTWRQYGGDLEDNLLDLSGRLKRGAYRAKPVRRVFVPKTDGRPRPLGVTALEDKIVQRATVEVLNTIYETDFLGFSYGFRPGRSQHNALDALYVGLLTRKVNWVLDMDIRRFFDAIDHGWLVKTELRRRLHDPVPEVGSWLRSVVGGHLRYYGVPTNSRALRLFRFRLGRLWYRSMRRRSQKTRLTWERMSRLLDHWLPPPRVCHPYPLHRLGGTVAVAWKDAGGQHAGLAMDRAGATDSYGGGEGDGVCAFAYGAISPSG